MSRDTFRLLPGITQMLEAPAPSGCGCQFVLSAETFTGYKVQMCPLHVSQMLAVSQMLSVQRRDTR